MPGGCHRSPELAAEDVLRVRDERFRPETTAVVTGAASGIGRATAVALTASGLTAVATDVDGDVRGFSVSTGYVSTPLVTDQVLDTAAQRGISEREVGEDVMLGQSRVGEMMIPLDVANLFVLGFSKHARHLDGGDLLFDGGMTLTCE